MLRSASRPRGFGDLELPVGDGDDIDVAGGVVVEPPDGELVWPSTSSVAVRTSYSGWCDSSAIGTLGAFHGWSPSSAMNVLATR